MDLKKLFKKKQYPPILETNPEFDVTAARKMSQLYASLGDTATLAQEPWRVRSDDKARTPAPSSSPEPATLPQILTPEEQIASMTVPITAEGYAFTSGSNGLKAQVEMQVATPLVGNIGNPIDTPCEHNYVEQK